MKIKIKLFKTVQSKMRLNQLLIKDCHLKQTANQNSRKLMQFSTIWHVCFTFANLSLNINLSLNLHITNFLSTITQPQN